MNEAQPDLLGQTKPQAPKPEPRGLYRGAGACTHCGGLAKGEIMVPYLSGQTAHVACYREHAEAVARGERRW